MQVPQHRLHPVAWVVHALLYVFRIDTGVERRNQTVDGLIGIDRENIIGKRRAGQNCWNHHVKVVPQRLCANSGQFFRVVTAAEQHHKRKYGSKMRAGVAREVVSTFFVDALFMRVWSP